MHPEEDVPAVPDPHLPCQGYCLKQPWRTLAYAQALQYWAKKANPPCPNEPHHLVTCVHELRQAMKPYTTFSDNDVFEGLTCGTSEAGVEEAMQPNPTKSTLADDPATLMTIPSTPVDQSATLVTTPSIPAEESVAFVTIPTVLEDEAADSTALLEPTSDTGKAEDPEYPKWIKVHLSHLAAFMGSVPPPWETSGSTSTTVAPVRGELSTTWQKNSGSSREIQAQPCLRAPWSQHTMRKKMLEPN